MAGCGRTAESVEEKHRSVEYMSVVFTWSGSYACGQTYRRGAQHGPCEHTARPEPTTKEKQSSTADCGVRVCSQQRAECAKHAETPAKRLCNGKRSAHASNDQISSVQFLNLLESGEDIHSRETDDSNLQMRAMPDAADSHARWHGHGQRRFAYFSCIVIHSPPVQYF